MKKTIMAVITAAMLLTAHNCFAHTPLCSCWDEGDGTIICEGGFTDGSAAEGIALNVRDKKGEMLIGGKMDEYSEFSFKKPSVPYTVFFEAGEGHVKKINSVNIVK